MLGRVLQECGKILRMEGELDDEEGLHVVGVTTWRGEGSGGGVVGQVLTESGILW